MQFMSKISDLCKETWMTGTMVKRTDPVSDCVQLEGGAVVSRHAD